MPQQAVWENEYRQPQLVTKEDQPQSDLLRFLKFLKKQLKREITGLKILDLGSGTGRNANFLAELGNKVFGFEISATAVALARARAREMKVAVDYQIADIGKKYLFDNESFDLVIDVTSSNSLNTKEREIYLSEVNRVLKKGGYFFVKGLCKDGDKNAKALLKKSPGTESDTYIIEEMKLEERVFTQADFVTLYSKSFEIIELTKKTNYSRFRGQSYKRNFWLAYMKKK